MRYPSINTLLALTTVPSHKLPPDPETEEAKQLNERARQSRALALRIRKILDGREEVDRCGSLNYSKLAAVDKLLENHGIEWIAWECEKHDYGNPDGFYYSNTGDSYCATLVLRGDKFLVSSWGDMVENHERRCTDCRKRTREEMNQ